MKRTTYCGQCGEAGVKRENKVRVIKDIPGSKLIFYTCNSCGKAEGIIIRGVSGSLTRRESLVGSVVQTTTEELDKKYPVEE